MSDDWRSRLLVEEAKLTRYLLSLEHQFGRSKALFFQRFGFSIADPDGLGRALLSHGTAGELLTTEETQFGRKYVVEGALRSPDGRDPLVRSVWFENEERDPVRLVTAYPAGART